MSGKNAPERFRWTHAEQKRTQYENARKGPSHANRYAMSKCGKCGRYVRHSGNLERHVRSCRRCPTCCRFLAVCEFKRHSKTCTRRVVGLQLGPDGQCPCDNVGIDVETPGSALAATATAVTVPITADPSSLDALLSKWELQAYLADFQSIGCVDVSDLTRLSESASANFTTVMTKMRVPERKRLLRVLRSFAHSPIS